MPMLNLFLKMMENISADTEVEKMSKSKYNTVKSRCTCRKDMAPILSVCMKCSSAQSNKANPENKRY